MSGHAGVAGRPLRSHPLIRGSYADPLDSLLLQPMGHVENMPVAIEFDEALGASGLSGSSDGDFVILGIGGGQLALLAHPIPSRTQELSTSISTPLGT